MSGQAVRIAAQAKLNLHLRVLSREDSGFHAIETVFHRIDLADEITLTITAHERTIDVEGDATGPAESNLAFRAASAFALHTGWPAGFRIELEKRIPVGAGLGGGSADAAAVLRALNSIASQPIPKDGLLQLASSLGADVTFLAGDAVMALAWGRGERMLKCAPLPARDILLLTPGFAVSTADAYRWLDEDRAASGDTVRAPISIGQGQLSTWESIAELARNDFEAVVVSRHPMLEGYLERLRSAGASFAAMTGSGSTIFGVLDAPPGFELIPGEHHDRIITTKTSIDVVQPIMVG